MKKILNFILAFIFSLTIILTCFSLTVLSKRLQVKTIKNDTSISKKYNIDEDIVENDLLDYVKNDYKISHFENKEYQKNINFFKYTNFYKIRFLVYIINIIFIIVVGSIFNKTKKIHNIYTILLISSILMIIFYGFVYVLFDYNVILNKLVMTFLHLVLFISDLFFMIFIFNRKISTNS